MRGGSLFSAILLAAAGSLLCLCALPAQAQKIPKRCLPHPAVARPPQVYVDRIAFDRTKLPSEISRDGLLASLRSRVREAGSGWRAEAARAVRDAWQDAGYFQAVAKVTPRLAVGAAGGHVALTIHVDPGPQYRLSRIRIRTVAPGGKLDFSRQTLRDMIPLRYGEMFDRSKLLAGIREIREFYGARGYIDMTVTRGFHIHSKIDRLSIYLFLDQGTQYRVGRLTILGLGPSLKSLLRSKISPGDVFNWNHVLSFYQSQQPVLPPHASPQDDEVYRVPKTDKVDVWLDFRACPTPASTHPTAPDPVR